MEWHSIPCIAVAATSLSKPAEYHHCSVFGINWFREAWWVLKTMSEKKTRWLTILPWPGKTFYPFSYTSDIPSMSDFLSLFCNHLPLLFVMTFLAKPTGFSYLFSNPHDEIPMEAAMSFFFSPGCMLSLTDMAQKNYLKLAPMLLC